MTQDANSEDYWDDRDVDISSLRTRIARRAKSNKLLLSVASIVLWSRLADEAFIRSMIQKYRPKVLLDLACGAGKASLPALVDTVYGIDIQGYPEESARSKGYAATFSYKPPHYDLSLPQEVDMITCINLNAHIPFTAYAGIIGNALRFLKPTGVLILVNEHDNAGPSYRRFSDPDRKRRLVSDMDHHYFESRDAFLDKFRNQFPGLHLIHERSLAPIAPMIQHYVYSTGREPSSLARLALLCADCVVGPFNYLYARIKPDAESFLKAMVFKKVAVPDGQQDLIGP